MPQPLSGVLVLDFTTLLPGPLATLMLAEAGAEVIKIERPGGEDGRRGSPPFDGVASGFALLNRGKQGLVLDLKDAAGRERLMPLIERAAELVGQFPPGGGGAAGPGATGLLALQPGPADRPVVPPGLIADIGGGSMPAVINILLGLRQRDATGQGCHIDVAMADAMFTFAWLALAVGQSTGRYPGPGELRTA